MSATPRIALATCAPLPGGHPDDAGLPAALGGAAFAVWDDPAVDWAAYDLVVVRSTWDYHRRRDAFLAWADTLGGRLVNPPEVLRWNTDKRYLSELATAGLPVVDTTLVAPGDALRPLAGEYVVKPTVSAGSRDTARFGAGPGDARRAAALASSIHGSGRTAMVQPYVVSVDERGETALLHFDGVFSHAVHKAPLLRPGADPTGDPVASVGTVAREPTAAERAVADRVLAWIAQRFGAVPVYARIDLVQDDGGDPLLLELELTEPSLFFEHGPGALRRFAAAVAGRMADR